MVSPNSSTDILTKKRKKTSNNIINLHNDTTCIFSSIHNKKSPRVQNINLTDIKKMPTLPKLYNIIDETNENITNNNLNITNHPVSSSMQEGPYSTRSQNTQYPNMSSFYNIKTSYRDYLTTRLENPKSNAFSTSSVVNSLISENMNNSKISLNTKQKSIFMGAVIKIGKLDKQKQSQSYKKLAPQLEDNVRILDQKFNNEISKKGFDSIFKKNHKKNFSLGNLPIAQEFIEEGQQENFNEKKAKTIERVFISHLRTTKIITLDKLIVFQIQQGHNHFPQNLSCDFDKKYVKTPLKWYINQSEEQPSREHCDIYLKGPIVQIDEQKINAVNVKQSNLLLKSLGPKKNMLDLALLGSKNNVVAGRKDQEDTEKPSIFDKYEKKITISVQLSTKIPIQFLTFSFTNQIVKTSVKRNVGNPFSEESVLNLKKLHKNREKLKSPDKNLEKKNQDIVVKNYYEVKFFNQVKREHLMDIKKNLNTHIENVIERGKEKRRQDMDKKASGLYKLELKNVKHMLFNSFIDMKNQQSDSQKFFQMVLLTVFFLDMAKRKVALYKYQKQIAAKKLEKVISMQLRFKKYYSSLPRTKIDKTRMNVLTALKFCGVYILKDKAAYVAEDVLGKFFLNFNRILEVKNAFNDFHLYIKNIQKSFRQHMITKKKNIEKLEKQWEREICKLIECKSLETVNNLVEDLPFVSSKQRFHVLEHFYDKGLIKYILKRNLELKITSKARLQAIGLNNAIFGALLMKPKPAQNESGTGLFKVTEMNGDSNKTLALIKDDKKNNQGGKKQSNRDIDNKNKIELKNQDKKINLSYSIINNTQTQLNIPSTGTVPNNLANSFTLKSNKNMTIVKDIVEELDLKDSTKNAKLKNLASIENLDINTSKIDNTFNDPGESFVNKMMQSLQEEELKKQQLTEVIFPQKNETEPKPETDKNLFGNQFAPKKENSTKKKPTTTFKVPKRKEAFSKRYKAKPIFIEKKKNSETKPTLDLFPKSIERLIVKGFAYDYDFQGYKLEQSLKTKIHFEEILEKALEKLKNIDHDPLFADDVMLTGKPNTRNKNTKKRCTNQNRNKQGTHECKLESEDDHENLQENESNPKNDDANVKKKTSLKIQQNRLQKKFAKKVLERKKYDQILEKGMIRALILSTVEFAKQNQESLHDITNRNYVLDS